MRCLSRTSIPLLFIPLFAAVSANAGDILQDGVYATFNDAGQCNGPEYIVKDDRLLSPHPRAECKISPLRGSGGRYTTEIVCPGDDEDNERDTHKVTTRGKLRFEVRFDFEPGYEAVREVKWCAADVATLETIVETRIAEEAKQREEAEAKAQEIAKQRAYAAWKCEALEHMGMPEEYGHDRIWINRPGQAIFGSAANQKFWRDLTGPNYYGEERENHKVEIEQRKLDAAIAADRHNTKSVRDIVCGAAQRGLDIVFEKGYFSSQLTMVTRSKSNARSISATLSPAGYGPTGGGRWKISTLSVKGTTHAFPQEQSGIFLLCLSSSQSAETIGAYGLDFIIDIFKEDLGVDDEPLSKTVTNDLRKATSYCKPIRTHLGIDK